MTQAKDFEPGQWYNIRVGEFYRTERGDVVKPAFPFMAYVTHETGIGEGGEKRRLLTNCSCDEFDEAWVNIDEN